MANGQLLFLALTSCVSSVNLNKIQAVLVFVAYKSILNTNGVDQIIQIGNRLILLVYSANTVYVVILNDKIYENSRLASITKKYFQKLWKICKP